MADTFDPYREALVVESTTEWSPELLPADQSVRAKLEAALHADPQQVAELHYVRTHTGFCRRIVVTAADVARLGSR